MSRPVALTGATKPTAALPPVKPLTERVDLGRRPRFLLAGRYLQGYVTRSFAYEHQEFGRITSYELDMPAPTGLSGAPLLKVGTMEVYGVIYGSHSVETIEQLRQG